MIKFILTLLIAFPVLDCLAQKYPSIDSVPGAPVFVYTKNSTMEMLKDNEFITDNAKRYIEFLTKVLEQKLLSDSSAIYILIQNLVHANIALENYNAAEDNLDLYLAKHPSDILYYLSDKVFLTKETKKELSFETALAKEVKHLDRFSLERLEFCYGPEMMHKERAEFISQTPFGFLSSDTVNFRNNFYQINSLHTKTNTLNMTQFGDLLWVYGANIIADSVFNEFLTVQPFDFEKWAEIWENKIYHFKKGDSLHNVLACNYQVFDHMFFDSTIIWHIPGEIAGNHIDDDKNGIVDDVCGYQYNINRPELREPIVLSWQEVDTMAVKERARYLKTSYETIAEKYKLIFEHGSMAVELMLKGNPRVKFMAICDEDLSSAILDTSLFTKDIYNNRHLIDSVVILEINRFQEMALYCNRYDVRVVEINAGQEKNDFYFRHCGVDSAASEEFAEKMMVKIKEGYKKAYLKAPNTLYLNSAANDNIDIGIDSMRKTMTSVRLPNVMVIGGLNKDLHKSFDSNYGSRVDVFAPSRFPLLLVKYKTRRNQFYHNESAGTSAAAPVVANLAVQILELNPKLTAAQVKQIIINGADKEPYEKGINIINPKKTIALLKGDNNGAVDLHLKCIQILHIDRVISTTTSMIFLR
jgi:Subtilase family